MVKLVGKRGDTLIEVMLAVGIFSMVAVAVVAVMSSGTSSAQTALETTLAREEIDAQAEALRFIQGAYITDKNTGSAGKYTELWKKITEKAIVINGAGSAGVSEERVGEILNYAPTNCNSLYDSDGEVQKYGFIINTKKIGIFDNYEDVLRTSSLVAADTYPHLTFLDQNGSEGNLIKGGDIFYNAQGIYIIAVRDPGTVIIGGEEEKQSAYFDFYIRTCWYGTGDQISSNISTVIRLYDPDAVKEISKPGYIISYYNNDGTSEYNGYSQFIKSDALATEEVTLADISGLEGWSCSAGAEIIDYEKGSRVELQKLSKCLASNSNTIKLYAVTSVEYEIQYWSNGGKIQGYTPSSFSTADDNVNITSSIPYDISNDRDFLGWSCYPDATSPTYGGLTNVNSISHGSFKDFISKCSDDNHTINLYAVWQNKASSITFTVIWTGNDSSKRPTAVFVNNERKTFNSCVRISGSSSYEYQCTINSVVSTKSDTTYYLSIDVFKYTNKPYCPLQAALFNRCLVDILTVSGGFSGDLSVMMTGHSYYLNSGEVTTFNWQKQARRSNYWNVFKIYKGEVTDKDTFSADPDRSY